MARVTYEYYLRRFSGHSAVFLIDMCLRLALLEQRAEETTAARKAFRAGARIVCSALAALDHNLNDDSSVDVDAATIDSASALRERSASLYCSWGLLEYKHAHPHQHRKTTTETRSFDPLLVKRSLSYGIVQHGVNIDASKQPILKWSIFNDATTAPPPTSRNPPRRPNSRKNDPGGATANKKNIPPSTAR